jgi:uncharacterized protein YndB with AHSA1/START domain
MTAGGDSGASRVCLALKVPASPEVAFAVFTQEIGAWWQPSGLFQITSRGDGRLAFEPGTGGRLLAIFEDEESFEIGRVSVWEPGRRLVFSWRQQSFPEGRETEVEVRFQAAGDETLVCLEHRAWDRIPRGSAARHGFPESSTLEHVARWWRRSLSRLQRAAVKAAGSPPGG